MRRRLMGLVIEEKVLRVPQEVLKIHSTHDIKITNGQGFIGKNVKIYCSANQGETWEKLDLSLSMDSNPKHSVHGYELWLFGTSRFGGITTDIFDGFSFGRITMNEADIGPLKIDMEGDVMSLCLHPLTLEKRTHIDDYGFFGAFHYFMMGLTTPPDISATSIGNRGCLGMFSQCFDLTKAPILLATTLGTECYKNMFSECNSLTKIKLAYTGTDTTYTDGWVTQISTSGTLYKAGTQYSSSGDSTYPSSWTQISWTPINPIP